MSYPSPQFDVEHHESELVGIIRELREAGELDQRSFDRILRRYPKDGRGAFSKSDIIRGFRVLAPRYGWEAEEDAFVARLRMKPVRTLSGVAPVTVLTKPFPCPGKCIFCPNDVRMPKSYLSREPGAQRAAQHDFDPYGQALTRLLAFHHTGHRVDKVELIILGGTWSFYPEPYQVWFIKRCFDAMNDFEALRGDDPGRVMGRLSFEALREQEIDGRGLTQSRCALAEGEDLEEGAELSYNQVVAAYLREHLEGRLVDRSEEASWDELAAVQRRNEGALARCVGLVVETRPDHLDEAEVLRVRKLGGTKVQIGYQSLSDEVLALNRRGHDVAATRRAMALLRRGGFKIHAHWMPNLHGSDPERDIEDFARIFDDPAFRPDELKIYPCSLIESAELMRYYEDGRWRPYSEAELLHVITECLLQVPPWCRVTRVIRDIPGDDILVGNKTTNFREVAERELERRGLRSQDIRAREVRGRTVAAEALHLDRLDYDTTTSHEVFLQYVTDDGSLAGFCRLSMPRAEAITGELEGAAMIREVHVYGAVVGIGARQGGRAQHLGLGRKLVDEGARIAAEASHSNLAVISSVGTRDYYRGLGFADGELYQHRGL